MRRRTFLTGLPATLAAPNLPLHKPAAHAAHTPTSGQPAPGRLTPGRPNPGRGLTMGQSTTALTLDPTHGGFSLFPGGEQVALCLYDGLLGVDAAMRLVPLLARAYAMSPTLTACTLKLRPRVQFHDGTPLDAAAVKLNLERLMSPQRNPTNRQLWDKLAAIEIQNPDTIVIRTNAPFQQLPRALAHPSGGLVSPAAIARFGDDHIAAHPVGAGPYRAASFAAAQDVVLEPFEHYWAGRPHLAQLRFTTIDDASQRLAALRRDAVQVIDGVPAAGAGELQQDMAVAVDAVPGLRMTGFAINMTRPPLADPRVRRALNLAVSVPQIIDQAFYGYARVPNSPLAFAADGYAAVGQLTCDPAAATSLLAQAGYGPGKHLPLTLFAPARQSAADALLVDLVAGALRQLPITVTVRKIAGGGYWDELRQAPAGLRWDLALFGFQPDNASGLHHLTTVFRSNRDPATIPDAWNIGHYRNPEVDRLIEAAATAANPAAYDAALQAAQTLIWHDAPYVWLPVADIISAARTTVSGVEVSPTGTTLLRHAAG
jgi:ABC-type transport system substrate-binding protein